MSNLVFVRVRPLKAQEKEPCLTSKPPILQCKAIDGKTEKFEFDRVFSQKSTQSDMFEGVKHIVHSVLEEGYNGTIMAYGQTSAGKTHTMFGTGSSEQRGIVPRCVGLASEIASAAKDCTIKLQVSVVEIYNEKCRDLLEPSQDNLQVFQDAQGVHVPGMKFVSVCSEQDCLRVVQKGMSGRALASTNMNEASSRSHCLVILSVEKTWNDGRKQCSKLCLVDLAGSERQSKTGAQGMTLTEGQNINKSLLVLGSVVNALNDANGGGKESKSRVPYRDSKLTRLLQDSLGGSAKTCIVICCSPSMSNYTETLSSLRFGARARAIESKAQPTAVVAAPVKMAAQDEIAALKKKLEDAEGGGGGGATVGAVDDRSLKALVWTIAALAQAAGVALFFAAESLCSDCAI